MEHILHWCDLTGRIAWSLTDFVRHLIQLVLDLIRRVVLGGLRVKGLKAVEHDRHIPRVLDWLKLKTYSNVKDWCNFLRKLSVDGVSVRFYKIAEQ